MIVRTKKNNIISFKLYSVDIVVVNKSGYFSINRTVLNALLQTRVKN